MIGPVRWAIWNTGLMANCLRENSNSPGRIVRATDFKTEARDPIALIKTATRATATIEMDAMVARGISGPIAIPSRRANPSQTLRRRGFPPS